MKKARKLNKIEFERVANTLLYKTKDEIKAIAKDPTTPAIELIVASIIAKGVDTGDDKRLSFLLDRLIGKVSDKVQHSFPKRTVIERPGGTEVVLGAEPNEDED